MGIGTTTLGFGEAFDEDLLRAMADAGGGGTYYIEHVEQAAGVFEQEIEGLLSIGAQNLRVQVTPGAHAESVQVAHAYPSHSEGDVLTVELGDLYAREPRRILMEVLLSPDLEAGQEADVAEITVTAHVLTPEGGVELRTISLPITLSPEEGGRTDPVVRKEALLLAAARAREEALRAQEAGDYALGSAALGNAVRYLTSASRGDADLVEEIEDLRLMASRFDADAVSRGDIKRMKQRSYDSHRGRGTRGGTTRRTFG
jgi:Ca-activated chloride channel family protein